jgi:hypothetical protein
MTDSNLYKVEESFEQLLNKKKAELTAEMKENQSFAMELWNDDKVKVDIIPQKIAQQYRYLGYASFSTVRIARVIVKHDSRYTVDVDIEGNDENGDYANYKDIGTIILDSDQAQKCAEELCSRAKSKKDIKDLQIPWEFYVKDQWNEYLDSLEQYKVRQEKIAELKITSNSLREQLRKIETEIEELDVE